MSISLESDGKSFPNAVDLLLAWDQDYEQRMEAAIKADDNQKELHLQRELAYRRSLQGDQWAETFFQEIQISNELTPLSALQKHITDSAEHLQDDLLKKWLKQHRTSPLVSSPLSEARSLSSSPLLIIKPLSIDDRMKLAVQDVRDGIKTCRHAAKIYGLNHKTVKSRLNGKPSRADKSASEQLLTPNEEQSILNFIDTCTELGFPARLYMLEEKAILLLRLRVVDPPPIGKTWAHRFIKRHSEYKCRFLRHLDQDRYWNTDPVVFKKWFDLVEKIMKKNDITKDRLFNMDEKGFENSVAGAVYWVIISKYAKNASSVHGGNRQLTTVIDAISYSAPLDPMIIFDGKVLQKAWFAAYPEAVFAVSSNGWTDQELGTAWLKHCFIPQTAHIDGKKLLLLDGHNWHTSVEFIETCWNHDIIPLCLPPHTTHFLQPLDVGVFGPLEKAYKKQLEHRNRLGETQVDKVTFLTMLRAARENSLISVNVKAAWAACGFYPFDPQRVLQKIVPACLSTATSASDSKFVIEIPPTPANAQQYVALLGNLQLFFREHSEHLNKAKKAAVILFADRHLLQDTNKELFKANMRKTNERLTTRKRGRYPVAFGRVLTKELAEKSKEDDAAKEAAVAAKKELAAVKKAANLAKKEAALASAAAKKMATEEKKAAALRKKLELAEKREIRQAKKRQLAEENAALPPASKRRRAARGSVPADAISAS